MPTPLIRRRIDPIRRISHHRIHPLPALVRPRGSRPPRRAREGVSLVWRSVDGLMDSAVVEGDARDPVQTANRQMFLALTEGRLRDADRFRSVSIATYRAQGAPVDAFTESYLSLESAIDAGAPPAQALRDFEAARAVAPPTSRAAATLSAARVYAKLGLASRMKAALADFDRSLTDSTARKRYADSRAATVTELAIAEGRWAEAVASIRRADQPRRFRPRAARRDRDRIPGPGCKGDRPAGQAKDALRRVG